MRRRSGMLAGLTLAMVANGVAAQSPTPTTEATFWSAGRVESLGSGLWVVPPHLWEATPGDPYELTTRGDVTPLLTLYDTDETLCLAALVEQGGGPAAASAVTVATPQGAALRTEAWQDYGPDGVYLVTSYYWEVGSSYRVLTCTSTDPPTDRWLSIANSIAIDPLRQDQPTNLERRLRGWVPEAGFALTLPEDWSVVFTREDRPTTTGQMVMLAFMPGEDTCRAWYWPHGRHADVAWSDLEGFVEAFIAMFRSAPATLATTAIELPSGSAVRIDDVDEGANLERSAYLVTDGTSYYSLTCFGVAAPQDRWQSIAETFEFRPAEE